VQTYFSEKGFDVLLVSVAAIGYLYVLAQPTPRLLYVLSNGLPPVLAFIALVFAVAGLVRNGALRDRIAIVWLAYTFGIFLWLLGESTWGVYALVYHVATPFPSTADLFWLAGYVPLMYATVLQAWPFRDFLLSKRMLTIIGAVLGVACLLLAALVPPTYSSAVGAGLVGAVVVLAYPFLDVALLVVSFPILFLFGRGKFWRPFLFIIVGLIFSFLADVLFTWTTLNGTYYDGNFFELFFHWSYLAFAYGFYLRFRSRIGAVN